jgi:RHS repeat-associated protein
MTDPMNMIERYTYDSNGNVFRKTDRNGTVATHTYDKMNRLTNVSFTPGTGVPATGAVSYTYTLTGALRTEQNGTQTITYTYDAAGRLTRESLSDGTVKDYTYDIGGNRLTFRTTVGGMVRLNQSYEYDRLNRLTVLRENNATAASYTYDANGNRTSLTYPNGVSTTYTYNHANLVKTLENRRGSAILSNYAYTYYLDGNQETVTENNGATTAYTYDGLRRLTRETFTQGENETVKSYFYDESGNRRDISVMETIPNVLLEYSYYETYNFNINANNRIDFDHFDPTLRHINKLFDVYHELHVVRPTQGFLPAGAATLFVNGDTLLSNSNSTLFLTNPYIDPNTGLQFGLLSTIAFSGFCVVQTHVMTKSDSSPNQIMALMKELATMNDNLDASIKSKAATRMETVGDVLTKEDEAIISAVLASTFNLGIFSFDDDNADTTENKKAIENERMTVDTVMQVNTGTGLKVITKRSSYVYDANNRMTREITDGIVTDYTHDNNGNQRGASGGNNFTNTHNARNQLTSTVRSGVTSSYTYLSNGYRYSKIVGSTTTRHMWDGANIVHDLNGSGVVTDSYLHGIELVRSRLNGYYLYNGRGDVVQLANESMGFVFKTYRYDGFGNEVDPVSTDNNPFRYAGSAGYYWDKETQNHYIRARYYNPRTGRFISEDPIRDGLNWYTYASNDPVNRIDPSGLADVMLQPILDKNKNFSSMTVSKNQVVVFQNAGTRDAKWVVVDYKMANGHMIVDNKALAAGFGIRLSSAQEYSSRDWMHQSGDKFGSADDAALAFALRNTQHSTSISKEIGAMIYSVTTHSHLGGPKTGQYHTFGNEWEGRKRDVVGGYLLNRLLPTSPGMGVFSTSTLVALAHTHPEDDRLFSPNDRHLTRNRFSPFNILQGIRLPVPGISIIYMSVMYDGNFEFKVFTNGMPMNQAEGRRIY